MIISLDEEKAQEKAAEKVFMDEEMKKRGTVHEEGYFNKGDVYCSHSDYYFLCDVW